MSLLLKCKQLSLKLEKHRFIYTLGFSSYEIFNDFLSLFYRLFYTFPIKSNKIVISNISGRGYGESPKYIAEELLKNKDKYDLVWLINSEYMETGEIPVDIRKVKAGSLQSLYELATAKIWIDNTWKLPYMRKRKGQYFIQTWHGYGPKKIIKNPDNEPRLYIKALKRCSDMTDLFLVINEHSKELCHRDFWYCGDILESGYPRNDIFYSDSLDAVKSKVCAKLQIPVNKKIVLFAPTYRQDLNSATVNSIDVDACISTLNDKYGGEWIFLLRLHPLMKDIIHTTDATDMVIDASGYVDMQELLYISDVLITDYSSCMFDYMLMKKPCVLYAPDYDNYIDSRGLVISLSSLPFPIAKNNEELLSSINNFELCNYRLKIEEYLSVNKHYDDGRASADVVSWIEKRI